MILGMSLETYTAVHVAMSLVGIGTGFVVMGGLLMRKWLDGWTAVFLVSTAATSLSGFGFPFDRLLPSHMFGIISLGVLAVAIVARYAYHLAGTWRRIYVVCAVVALYLNVFVGVVQAFLKVPALEALAPNQTEGPFLAAQLVVLSLFIMLGILAAFRFRDVPVDALARG